MTLVGVEVLPDDDVRPSYTLLGSALDYMAKGLVASVETNIEQHYVEYVEAYVNAMWDKRGEVERIKASNADDQQARKAALNAFFAKLRKIKADLIRPAGSELQSSPEMHEWVDKHRCVVLPAKALDKAVKVWIDVEYNAQDYLAPMLRITKELEKMGVRLRNVLPLRTSVAPMHVTLDTATLAQLLFKSRAFDHLGMNVSTLVEKATSYKKEIWAAIFRTNERIFHSTSNYVFDHMIRTDGVSCCVVHRRHDVEAGYHVGRRRKRPVRETYVDELSADERRALMATEKTIVGVDPGMDNLLFFSTEERRKGETVQFRYTQAQRRCETKKRKFEKKELAMRTTTVVEGRTVAEWESSLSNHNFKTVSFDKFKECIRAKLQVNAKLAAFYREHTWRQLRLYGYFNRHRSETRMLEQLREKFGPPDQVIIGIGTGRSASTCGSRSRPRARASARRCCAVGTVRCLSTSIARACSARGAKRTMRGATSSCRMMARRDATRLPARAARRGASATTDFSCANSVEGGGSATPTVPSTLPG